MSIGGPPLALLYQREPGPRVRATLGAYFVLGALLSLGALAAAGHVNGRQLAVGTALVPFLVAGFAASGPLRRVLDARGLRTPVLALSAGSALLLVARSVLAPPG